jgi:YbbR domain-containing protein
MKKRIAEILGYFNPEKLKNDKRIVVFSVCLLIATSLWFLNALGKDYTTTLSYSVKYVNPPKNLFLANNPPSKLDLNVQAHGFTLLRHKLAFSFSPIVLDLSAISQSLEGDNNEYRVPSENLVRRIGAQVSKEITINGVSPQNILLVFDSLNTKKVPVLPEVELNFKPQFNLKGTVEAKPDSVEITGPAAILETIDVLHTEETIFEGLDKTVEKYALVAHPGNTDVSPDKVVIYIPVEKFTEKELILPVQVNHLPENVQLKLFPSNIAVTVMVGLSDYEEVSPRDFSATVDYNQALLGESYLEVKVETNKANIQLVKVVPSSVEYLIEPE